MTKEVRHIYAPNFNEISVNNLWTKFKENEFILEYIPDDRFLEMPEREYFISIVNTVYPDSIEALVEKCYSNRKLKYNYEEDNAIELTVEIKENLKLSLHPKVRYEVVMVGLWRLLEEQQCF